MVYTLPLLTKTYLAPCLTQPLVHSGAFVFLLWLEEYDRCHVRPDADVSGRTHNNPNSVKFPKAVQIGTQSFSADNGTGVKILVGAWLKTSLPFPTHGSPFCGVLVYPRVWPRTRKHPIASFQSTDACNSI